MAPDLSADDALLDGRNLLPGRPPEDDAPRPARDTRFSRDVLLRCWPDDEAGREAWGRELQRLGTPRRDLPHLLDAGVDGGRCWIVLPAERPAPTAAFPRAATALAPAQRARPRRRAASPTLGRTPLSTPPAPVVRGMLVGAGLSVMVGGVLVGLRIDADAQGAVAPAAGTTAPVSPAPRATSVRAQPVVVQPVANTTGRRPTSTTSPPDRADRRPVGSGAAHGLAGGPGRAAAPPAWAKAGPRHLAPKPHHPKHRHP